MTEREAILDRFASFPGRLAAAVQAAGTRPVAAGEWGPAEVVSHLIAVEEVVWRARLRDLATTADPRWSRTEPGLAAGLEDASLEELLSTFETARAGTAEIVRALDQAGWARSGTHAVYGRLDVAGLLGVASDHDEEHLRGIAPD